MIEFLKKAKASGGRSAVKPEHVQTETSVGSAAGTSGVSGKRGLAEKLFGASPKMKRARSMTKAAPSKRNPFLDARSEWNGVTGALVSSRLGWMVVGLFSLCIALAAVAGVIYIGNQSKIIPYIVQVDKAGTAIGGGIADATPSATARVKQATVAAFIEQSRLVTVDWSLQRKALDNVMALIRQGDPAGPKLNEYWNGPTGAGNPFERAKTQIVDITITSVIQASQFTWEVEWLEITRGRDGAEIDRMPMRALVTLVEDTSRLTSQEAVLRNPLGLFVQDFSWARRMAS